MKKNGQLTLKGDGHTFSSTPEACCKQFVTIYKEMNEKLSSQKRDTSGLTEHIENAGIQQVQ